MMASLPPSVRRSLAVGLLIMVLGGCYTVLIAPLVSQYRANALDIERARLLLGRYDEISERAAQENPRPSASRSDDWREDFLQGQGDQVLLANLQKTLSHIVATSGAQFTSARMLAPQELDDLTLLGIRLEFTGGLDAIRKAIFAIEAGRPRMIIRSAKLRPLRPVQAQSGSTQPPVGASPISAQLDIFGAAWPGQAK